MLRITIPLFWYALRIELLRPGVTGPAARTRRPQRLDQLSRYMLRDIGLEDRFGRLWSDD